MYFLKFNIAILAGGSISSLASNKQMQIFFFFFLKEKKISTTMHFENVKYAQLKTWIRNKKGRRGGRREREKKERMIYGFSCLI